MLTQSAASRLRIADMDGDGRNDLLSAGASLNGVLLWRQNAAGALEAPLVVPDGTAVDHGGG
ncbi:hypothetical protein FSC37_14135 [Piscinibacter aquaticus]|uniref:VCBS repeat-containing protein n=1 Tax=Piscinibacter aquaticus TaxID=392597 RepID=A0A5C6U0T4_9BURK|nr:hypothetical protein FSC37_14135 [Piscinibacter aquaticus]